MTEARDSGAIVTALTLADEIVVLVLDDETGEIDHGYMPVASVAVAAGILMELALRGRIDTDPATLYVIDAAPTGDPLLDGVLNEIATAPEQRDSGWWIDSLSLRHDDLVGVILARLVAAGILREEDQSFLWVFSHRAYPPVTGQEEREARGRLRTLLLTDDLPDPRDTLLLGLANATGAMSRVLTEAESQDRAGRIAGVLALEEIGRSVAATADAIWHTLLTGAANYPR